MVGRLHGAGQALAGLLTLALTSLAGCNYITVLEWEEKLAQLDEDGDGVPDGAGDCDDNDAERFPGNPDIPYDGIDNDCSGADEVDLDGDGFPGILRDDWEAAFPGAEWPAAVNPGPLDCRDDPEALAEAAQVWPGRTDDAPYDGLDADCAGDNDFDVDGDTQMPPTLPGGGDAQPAFEAFAAAWAWAGAVDAAAPYGDCDDFDPAVFTGGTEVWYDGADGDCSGGSDFDRDVDGQDSDAHGGTDCDDDDPGVYAGAAETWYDGIDGDCAGDDDYDQDGDGATVEGAPTGTADDCQDADGTVHPQALEELGDTTDQDCFGGDDVTGVGFGGIAWTDPRRPVLSATDDVFLLATVAASYDDGTISHVDRGLGLVFERDTGRAGPPTPGPVVFYAPAAPAYIPYDGVDLVTTADSYWGTTAYDRSGATYTGTKIGVWDPPSLDFDTSGNSLAAGSGVPYAAVDLDSAEDGAGALVVWSCGEGMLQATHAVSEGNGNATAVVDTGLTILTCHVDPVDPFLGTACGNQQCATYSFDPGVPSLTVASTASTGWRWTDRHGDLLVRVGSNLGLEVDDGTNVISVLGAKSIWHGDAVLYDNTLYVAWIERGLNKTAWLSYGPPTGSLTTVRVDLDDVGRDLEPFAAAVHADADRVIAAFSAEDPGGLDGVGWAFWRP